MMTSLRPTDGIDLIAGAVHFHQLIVAGDEGMAVAQPLDGERKRTLRLLLPDDVAFAIAFGDALGVPLGDENAIVAENLHVARVHQAG